jgi:uncharacterized protein (DUF2345 family)
MSSPEPGYVFNDSRFGSLFIGSDSSAPKIKRPRQIELHSASNAHLKLFEDGGFELTSSPGSRLSDNINSNSKDGLNISANNIRLDARQGTLTLAARTIRFESSASDETLVFRSRNNIAIEASDTIRLEAPNIAIGAKTKLVLGSCGPIYIKGNGGVTIVEPKSKLIPTSLADVVDKIVEQLLPGASC